MATTNKKPKVFSWQPMDLLPNPSIKINPPEAASWLRTLEPFVFQANHDNNAVARIPKLVNEEVIYIYYDPSQKRTIETEPYNYEHRQLHETPSISKQVLRWLNKDKDHFDHIHQAIEKSRFMLELEDNWDEEGSVGYKEDTWIKAVNLLLDMVKQYFAMNNQKIPTPIIGLGPDGSIDISWKHSNKHLLINVDATDDLVTYSGDNAADNSLSGSFDLSEGGLWLLVWLMS
ncbi:MAG TPA: hypothetical protein DEF47_11250 [Herpetosiphon sp.]|uniref:Uncharacterized protein n=1 Tax=Herpetosiphon aurantiacus (strain ATCC 23779 / DSM 785 / 114-95) TaxID=316274 RepID=A9AWR5_HERA2|nr:hypothetical protein [Herpetosiphon sp.]ABX03316.1 hypothetical protein Haur_0668 [Herpetosiphon aurantiacus DSM 785]HBW50470.1 hypothetical protein [Herpetosiphon sp.]